MGPKSYRVHGLIKKRKRKSNLIFPTTHTHAPKRGTVMRQWSESQEEGLPTKAYWTLIMDFPTSQNEKLNFYCLMPQPVVCGTVKSNLLQSKSTWTKTLINPLVSSFWVTYTTEAASHNCSRPGPGFTLLPP